jgi:hypothetical protein
MLIKTPNLCRTSANEWATYEHFGNSDTVHLGKKGTDFVKTGAPGCDEKQSPNWRSSKEKEMVILLAKQVKMIYCISIKPK